MQTNNLQNERTLFEAWAKERGYDMKLCGENSRVGPADHYFNTATAHAWEVWLARAEVTTEASASYKTHVEDWAENAGWERESGEGAFEFSKRASYELGYTDAGLTRMPVKVGVAQGDPRDIHVIWDEVRDGTRYITVNVPDLAMYTVNPTRVTKEMWDSLREAHEAFLVSAHRTSERRLKNGLFSIGLTDDVIVSLWRDTLVGNNELDIGERLLSFARLLEVYFSGQKIQAD